MRKFEFSVASKTKGKLNFGLAFLEF